MITMYFISPPRVDRCPGVGPAVPQSEPSRHSRHRPPKIRRHTVPPRARRSRQVGSDYGRQAPPGTGYRKETDMTVTTPITDSNHPAGERHRPTIARVAGGGVIAAGVGAAVTSLYGLIIRAADVPMRAGAIGASAAQPLEVASFAVGVVICTFWGTVVAFVLTRLVRD